MEVRNEDEANKAWLAYIKYLEDNAKYGYNFSVAWTDSNASYFGIVKNHSYWKITFKYYQIGGANNTGAEYVTEKGNVTDLNQC